jgi:hypothetical protein
VLCNIQEIFLIEIHLGIFHKNGYEIFPVSILSVYMKKFRISFPRLYWATDRTPSGWNINAVCVEKLTILK